eukprot:g3288.t1
MQQEPHTKRPRRQADIRKPQDPREPSYEITSPRTLAVHTWIDLFGFGEAQDRAINNAGCVWLAIGTELLLVIAVTRSLADLWDLDGRQRGMVVAIVFFGMFFGNLLGGFCSDRAGRKIVLQASYLLIAVTSCLSAMAVNYGGLLFWRFCVGVAFGLGQPVATTFIAEMVPTDWRATVVLSQCLFAVGEFYAAFLVWWDDENMLQLDWKVLTVMGAWPAVFAFVYASLTLEESPRWLSLNQQPKEAERILTLMRSQNKPTQGMPAEFKCALVGVEPKSMRLRVQKPRAIFDPGQHLHVLTGTQTHDGITRSTPHPALYWRDAGGSSSKSSGGSTDRSSWQPRGIGHREFLDRSHKGMEGNFRNFSQHPMLPPADYQLHNGQDHEHFRRGNLRFPAYGSGRQQRPGPPTNFFPEGGSSDTDVEQLLHLRSRMLHVMDSSSRGSSKSGFGPLPPHTTHYGSMRMGEDRLPDGTGNSSKNSRSSVEPSSVRTLFPSSVPGPVVSGGVGGREVAVATHQQQAGAPVVHQDLEDHAATEYGRPLFYFYGEDGGGSSSSNSEGDADEPREWEPREWGVRTGSLVDLHEVNFERIDELLSSGEQFLASRTQQHQRRNDAEQIGAEISDELASHVAQVEQVLRQVAGERQYDELMFREGRHRMADGAAGAPAKRRALSAK